MGLSKFSRMIAMSLILLLRTTLRPSSCFLSWLSRGVSRRITLGEAGSVTETRSTSEGERWTVMEIDWHFFFNYSHFILTTFLRKNRSVATQSKPRQQENKDGWDRDLSNKGTLMTICSCILRMQNFDNAEIPSTNQNDHLRQPELSLMVDPI